MTDFEDGNQFNLQFVDRDKDLIIYEIPVRAGEKIIYTYIHSSDGTPVEQVFKLDHDGVLHLKEEIYSWHGAGLETGVDKEIIVENGKVRVTGYDRAFPELPLRVAWTVTQTITVNEEDIILNDLAPGGSSLIIRTGKDR